jgi:hypothetical protein
MLAHLDLNTTGTLLQVYQVPNTQTATVNLRLANRNNTAVKVRITAGPSLTPDNSYFILFDQTIYPNDTYTEAGLVLNSQDYILVQTDTTGVSAVVWGFSQ